MRLHENRANTWLNLEKIMKVILQRDVSNLGSTGDIVKVRDGYGRNFLIPRGLAIIADERNTRALEHQKRLALKLAERETAAAQAIADQINQNPISFERVTEEGRLFGSVTALNIVEAVVANGINIPRKSVQLENPIRELGRHEVQVNLGRGVTANLIVFVQSK